MTEPTQTDARPDTFDQRACEILRQAHALIFSQCPEVRSLSSSIDCFGMLNDANIQKGVWSGPEGPVTAADAIFGSLFQTLRMAEMQFSVAVDTAAQLREEVQLLSAENIRLWGLINGQEEKEKGQDAADVGDGVPINA